MRKPLRIMRAATAGIDAAAQSATEQPAGPPDAFVPGQEAESRRKLFNRISFAYDEVGGGRSPDTP